MVQKREKLVYFKLHSDYHSEDKTNELYEAILFYLPYSPGMSISKVKIEIKKLLISDIQPIESKL